MINKLYRVNGLLHCLAARIENAHTRCETLSCLL